MRNTNDEREARKRRVYDLRNQGLSYRDIIAQLTKEGFPISLRQVQLDLLDAKGESAKDTFPFYCFRKPERMKYYPNNCCFMDKIGLPPLQSGGVSELYDYQHQLFMEIGEHQYYAVVKSRQIGMTHAVLWSLLYYALYGFIKGHKAIIIPGTRSELSEDHIGLLKRALESGGYNELIDNTNTTKSKITFKDGTEIRAMPSNTTTVRGLAVKFVFLDEAAMFDDKEQKEILNSIRPTIATTKGHICMISTPRGRRGVFYNVISEHNSWHKTYFPYTVAQGRLLPQEHIDKEMKAPDVDFQQEYNCAFSTPDNAVYTQGFIDSCKADYELIEYAPDDWRLNEPHKKWIPDINDKSKGEFIQAYSNCVAGVDVAVTKDYTSLVVLAKFDNIWKPLVCKQFPHAYTWGGVIQELEKLAIELNIQEFAVDATSMGQAFADMVVGKRISVDPVMFTNQTKREMINHCKKLLQSKELSLPIKGCPELLTQFLEQQQTDLGQNRIKYSHPEGKHDDLLWSFHMACKLAGEKNEQVVMLL